MNANASAKACSFFQFKRAGSVFLVSTLCFAFFVLACDDESNKETTTAEDALPQAVLSYQKCSVMPGGRSSCSTTAETSLSKDLKIGNDMP